MSYEIIEPCSLWFEFMSTQLRDGIRVRLGSLATLRALNRMESQRLGKSESYGKLLVIRKMNPVLGKRLPVVLKDCSIAYICGSTEYFRSPFPNTANARKCWLSSRRAEKNQRKNKAEIRNRQTSDRGYGEESTPHSLMHLEFVR